MAPLVERSAAWRQFLLAKQTMLGEYDRALSHARTQPVAVHHGVVGEAAVRDWLGTFLPKRFGVTSGYIRSQGLPESHQSSHFDVIIYDQLEAPILWIDESRDKSDSGRARIIPVEHVGAVLETKAQFSRRTVDDTLEKLAELSPFCAGNDGPGERYPRYFRPGVVLGALFFELRSANAQDLVALERFRTLEFLRFFYGAVILRGDGFPEEATALVRQTVSDEPMSSLFVGDGLLHNVATTSSVEIAGRHCGAMLSWSAMHFANFAFDILAFLNGTYDGRSSSFHGIDLNALKE